ncbi:MAG TPA: L-histidine N(alpha)-methyltransferase [Segetibacter sp.]|jgi:dimethylhistidine N-methyltransferase
MSQFLEDVLKGLSAKEKFLQSKYFYDAKGDTLFQKIMASKEYYPTRCEMEIFTQKTKELVDVLTEENTEFDIVELGAGDATKSIHLLKGLLDNKVTFTYFPVDISGNVINLLHRELPEKLPGLQLQGLNGEYLSMLEKAKTLSDRIKVVLFLGGNIGNVALDKAGEFSKSLREHLKPGDLVLVGFDLKKDPKTVLDAYNDSAGFTRDFNMNLLTRINNELKGNFDLGNFYHYPTYDPATGACKSFLVSSAEQQVSIAEKSFCFAKGEPIFMEISQKYTVEQTDELASQNGFEPIHHFFDAKGWFLDAVWRCV